MVSSRRRTEAAYSPCSSYRDPWKRQQTSKTVDRARNEDEQLSVEGEREVARRVLEDLDRLYFDDEVSEEEDSDSEWGSGTSSCSSRGERTAGGLTLEELIVAVNAAIEFHRPVVFPPQPVTKTKEEDEVSHYSEDHRQFSHHRHRAEHLTEPESVLEMFQNMLEKKEKHFYDLRAMNAAAGDTMISQPKVVALRNATIDQQQQTVAYVRDQATETEENLHHPALDVSAAADFHLPVNSVSFSVHSRYSASRSKPIRPTEVGPTLADLAQSHRTREKQRSLRSAGGSSWESSSTSADRSPSVSSAHESESNYCSSISSKTSSRMSQQSRSSNQNSSKSQSQPRIDPKDQPFTQAHKDEISQAAPPPPSVVSSHVPSNSADVKWELDLSNLAF